MNLKKLGTALVVVLALGAVMASSALAAAVTEDDGWYTGASPGTLLSGSESVSLSGSSELVTEVGTTALKLKSTETECVGCTIKNEGGTAIGTYKIGFKNVSVVTPSTCAVEGGKIETKLMDIRPDYMIGTSSYVTFTSEEGEIIATIKLVKGSGSCALSGTYNITGQYFLKANNATGVFAVSQGLTGNGTINSEAGGALKFGSKPAELITTNTAVALSGAKKGQAFATK